MSAEKAPSTFSASAHGPGYWFGSAGFAALVAVAVVAFDLLEIASFGFIVPVIVAVFCVIQGARSMATNRSP